MKILILCDDEKMGRAVHDLYRSYDSNAIISVSREDGEAESGEDYIPFAKASMQSWTVVVRIVKEEKAGAEPLKIEALQTHLLVTEHGDTTDDVVKVASALYNDKIRYAGQACTCGANDYCKCH